MHLSIDQFHHNVESLHIIDNISHQGEGLNLTFQVRDGIISHDGEVHNTQLKPDWNKTESDIKDYIDHKKKGKKFTWMPATMEGCVVRISDTIAYIGQDIEDAIRSKILKRDEIGNGLAGDQWNQHTRADFDFPGQAVGYFVGQRVD